MENTLHSDGTITYWSVYQQVWVRRAEAIPARELAEMGAREREDAIAHLTGGAK